MAGDLANPHRLCMALVLAELPDAVRFRAPNETRSIEAAYLHAGLDHGPKVQGFVRFEGQLVLHQFCC